MQLLLLGLMLTAAAPTERVYVLPPTTPADAPFHELVAAEVYGLGYEVVSADDLQKLLELESDRAALTCDDATCLAEMAARADVDFVLNIKVGVIGRDTLLSLSLIDTATATATSRVSSPVSQDAPSISIREMVKGLFKPNKASTFKLPQSAEELRFAVLDLDTAGLDDDLAKNLTQVLSAELKRVEGASVIGRDDIAAVLAYEGDKASLGCDDDASCLAELGDALGVARIVVGQVGLIGDSYVVSLRLIRTEDVAVESRVTETFRGSPELLVNAMRYAAQRLLGIAGDREGSLLVSSNIADAELFVDGIPRGTLPGPPLTGLTPGRHELKVSADGYYEYSTDFYVPPGEAVTQWAELAELPAEFYETWWFWSAVGGAGAATFVGVATASTVGALFFINEMTRPRPLGPVKVTLPTRTGDE